MTLGMALFFMGWWVLWTIQEVGVLGFLKSTFAPKGGLKGALWLALLPLFLFVGVIEMVSIAIRPVSLSFRLFGNMYAGEIIFLLLGLWAATGVTGVIVGGLLNVGWSIFHILIVALQAYIFMMLTVVYIAMAHEQH